MALLLRKAMKARVADCVSIELDHDYVTFHGSAQEALAVYLSGDLILRLDEPLTVKHIRLHLFGIRRISNPTRNAWKHSSCEDEFHKQTWEFHDKYRTSPQTLPAGEYKYPFSILLDGSLPGTVEGVREASIAYSFKAEIGRKNGRDTLCRKPLRIIRVPELYTRELTLDEVWADKIAYRIQVPNTSVAFGTVVDVRYCFVPLLSDLKIEYVESEILEILDIAVNDGPMISSRVNSTTVICSDRHIIDDDFAADVFKDGEEYHLLRTLCPPRKLGQSVQDTEAMGIRVKHKLKITVRMQNPDGHLSELRLSIPIYIYLSPNYPVWDPLFSSQALPPPDTNFSNDEAPPPYGRHSFDQLFEPEAPST
ncbi:hypothetical protein BDV06DRAFT_231961 [Aspergillus oleicola]